MRLPMLIVLLHSVLFITSKWEHESLAKFKRATVKKEEFPASEKKCIVTKV